MQTQGDSATRGNTDCTHPKSGYTSAATKRVSCLQNKMRTRPKMGHAIANPPASV